MSPGEYGWHIDAPDQARVTMADMPLALLVACRLAKAEHRASGHPTAVRVLTHSGDGVLMGFCG
jgi:hypothetical protein